MIVTYLGHFNSQAGAIIRTVRRNDALAISASVLDLPVFGPGQTANLLLVDAVVLLLLAVVRLLGNDLRPKEDNL